MSYNVLTHEGAPAGRLELRRSGPRTEFLYENDTVTALSRLVLIAGDRPFNLGIPAPEHGGMTLRRTFTRLELTDLDLSGPLRFLLVPPDTDLSTLLEPVPPEPPADSDDAPVPADPGPDPSPEPDPPPCEPDLVPDLPSDTWSPLPDPATLFSDPVLQESARAIPGALTKQEGDHTLLALPFSPSKPFPLLPAFRYATDLELEGRHYMLFRLRDGVPV